MPLPVLPFAVSVLIFLTVSCSPYHSAGDARRLLVDRDGKRYGRVIHHGDSLVLPIVRGDGIAELFVRVQIGTSRGWWQIDTGAALCVVTPRVARHEGFTLITDGKIVTAAGAVDSQLGTLPSVRLGALEVREVTALSLDDDYANDFSIQGRRGHVIGILGADLLDFLNATIDLRANVVRLRAP